MKKYYIRSCALLLLLMWMFLAIGCKKAEVVPMPIVETTTDAVPTPKPNPKKETKAKGFDYDIDGLQYELVWSDEFDIDGAPDASKWGYDTGGHGWGNNELQYYTKGDNVTVKEGKLIIEARKEDYEGMAYTSTRLISKGKGDWLYGKIEVNAKLPSGVGTWPAIWMLPTDWSYGDWPASGEIDIMEHVGYDMNQIHASVHTQNYYHKIGTQKSQITEVAQVDTEFHTYSIEWLPDKILGFVDGQQYFEFNPSKIKTAPIYKDWPFDRRFHLLMNIAVGGSWGGVEGVDESIWPQTMEVDYVRVYQSEVINELVK